MMEEYEEIDLSEDQTSPKQFTFLSKIGSSRKKKKTNSLPSHFAELFKRSPEQSKKKDEATNEAEEPQKRLAKLFPKWGRILGGTTDKSSPARNALTITDLSILNDSPPKPLRRHSISGGSSPKYTIVSEFVVPTTPNSPPLTEPTTPLPPTLVSSPKTPPVTPLHQNEFPAKKQPPLFKVVTPVKYEPGILLEIEGKLFYMDLGVLEANSKILYNIVLSKPYVLKPTSVTEPEQYEAESVYVMQELKDPELWHKIFLFFYQNLSPFTTWQEAIYVLPIAFLYQMVRLLPICETLLCQQANSENVLTLSRIALNYNLENLQKTCLIILSQ